MALCVQMVVLAPPRHDGLLFYLFLSGMCTRVAHLWCVLVCIDATTAYLRVLHVAVAEHLTMIACCISCNKRQ